MWEAVLSYNPNRNTALSSWIYFHIRWSIIKYLNSEKKYRDNMNNLVKEPESSRHHNIWEYFPNNLTKLEKQIISLKLQNYSYRDIDRKFHKNRGWSNKIYHNLIKKVNRANKKKDSFCN